MHNYLWYITNFSNSAFSLFFFKSYVLIGCCEEPFMFHIHDHSLNFSQRFLGPISYVLFYCCLGHKLSFCAANQKINMSLKAQQCFVHCYKWACFILHKLCLAYAVYLFIYTLRCGYKKGISLVSSPALSKSYSNFESKSYIDIVLIDLIWFFRTWSCPLWA